MPGHRLLCVGVSFLLLAAGAGAIAVVPRLGHHHDEIHPRHRCGSNLKQIGLACVLYQQKNAEALPDRDGTALVSRLYECRLLEDPEVYVCGGSSQEPSRWPRLDASTCSYVGRRNTGSHRLTTDVISRAGVRTPLVADRSPDHHGGSRNVLFADLHVESIVEEEYQRSHAAEMGE